MENVFNFLEPAFNLDWMVWMGVWFDGMGGVADFDYTILTDRAEH